MKTITREEFEAIETSEFSWEVEETERKYTQTPHEVGIDMNTDEIEYKLFYTNVITGHVYATYEDLRVKFHYIARGEGYSTEEADTLTIDIDSRGLKLCDTNFFVITEDDEKITNYYVLQDLVEKKMLGGEWESIVRHNFDPDHESPKHKR